MTIEEAVGHLQAHIDSNPYGSGPSTYWPAEKALDAVESGLPHDLLTRYYQKVQNVWPEVPPRLENRSPEALSAWAEAARERDDILWNRVLIEYADGQPERVGHGFDLLRAAWSAPASPEAQPAITKAADDRTLVKALKHQIHSCCVTPFPIGWIACLVLEGGEDTIDLLRPVVFEQDGDLLNDKTLDDLRNLTRGHPLSPAAQTLLEEVDEKLKIRDEATGQNALFSNLGRDIPDLFSFALNLPAKNGYSLDFTARREWRSTAVWWQLSIGKKTPGFSANPNGIMSNRLKLDPVTLGDLKAWLEEASQRLKTVWVGPLTVEEKGFSPPLTPALEAYFGDLMSALPPKKKSVRKSKA